MKPLMNLVLELRRRLEQTCREIDGMGTIEMVVLIAILVGLALVFKDGILEYMEKLMRNLDKSVVDPSRM